MRLWLSNAPSFRTGRVPPDQQTGLRAFRRLVGLSGWTLVGHVSAAGVLLTAARVLEPSAFGAVTFALAAQGYLVVLGSMACGSIVIREAVQRPQDVDAIATSLFVLTARASLLVSSAALVAIACAPLAAAERDLLVLIALGTVPAAMSAQPLFDASHRQATGAAVTAVCEVAALGAVLALARMGRLDLLTVGGTYITKWSCASIGQWVLYRQRVHRFHWAPSSATVRLLARSSLPLLFATALFFVPLNAGVLFVRLRTGSADAALFGLAAQVASAYQILAALGVQVAQPFIYGERGMAPAFQQRLGSLATVSLVIVGLLAVTGAGAVIHWWLQPFYLGALNPAAWLIAAAALLTFSRLLSAYLVRFDEGRTILAAQTMTAVAYALACLLAPARDLRMVAAVAAPAAVLLGLVPAALRVRRRLTAAVPR